LIYGRANWNSGSHVIQDDGQWIANTVASNSGGDGWRPDDFGNTIATAYTLPTGSQQLDGFLERYSEADVFKITPTTAGRWNFTATPLYYSPAEPKLELLDSSGNVIASRDDADSRNGPTNEQLLNVDLTPGTYYVRVSNDARDIGELGYYKFAATQLPAGMESHDVGIPKYSGSVTYDAATGVFTQSGGGLDIWNLSDQFRYTYATLTGNGSITARLDGLDNIGTFTKAGVMIRQSLAANSAHAFLGVNPDGGIDSIWRSATGANSGNVNNSGFGPWVRITRTGNQFTFERSSDGTSWTPLGNVTIAMSGPVLIGLATSAWSGDKEAFATFSNVAITGNITPAPPTYNGLSAPTNLAATPASGANTSINLSWTASPGATGYVIERSIEGVDFFNHASVGAGTTTYTDVNPWGSMRWFYRVSAADGTAINSVPSAVASTVNKPNVPFIPFWTVGAITPNTYEIFLTWGDVQGETGYRIDRSTDGVNYSFVANTAASQTSFNVGGLVTDTAYTFRITPLTSVGDGVTTPLFISTQTRMGVIANLRFTAKSSNSMTIAWDDKNLETGYRIERSTNGIDWTFMGDNAAGVTTYTSNGLTPGTEYYFRVQPFNTLFGGDFATVFAAAPAALLPSGWANVDIGSVAGGTGGGGAAVNTGTGAWTAISAGSDVFGAADSFNFTYRTLDAALDNNTAIIARVTGVEATDNAAKAGLVLRQSLAANSKSVAIMINAGGGFGIDVRSRTAAGFNTNLPASAGRRDSAVLAAPDSQRQQYCRRVLHRREQLDHRRNDQQLYAQRLVLHGSGSNFFQQYAAQYLDVHQCQLGRRQWDAHRRHAGSGDAQSCHRHDDQPERAGRRRRGRSESRLYMERQRPGHGHVLRQRHQCRQELHPHFLCRGQLYFHRDDHRCGQPVDDFYCFRHG
jgi:hypothetical protein